METHSVSGVPKEIKKRELALGFLLTEEHTETKSPSFIDSLTALSTEDYPSSRFRHHMAVVHKKQDSVFQ